MIETVEKGFIKSDDKLTKEENWVHKSAKSLLKDTNPFLTKIKVVSDVSNSQVKLINKILLIKRAWNR